MDIIKSEIIAIRPGYGIFVLCPFCKKVHYHGLSEGVRYSHCSSLDCERQLYDCRSNKYTITINRYLRDKTILKKYKEGKLKK